MRIILWKECNSIFYSCFVILYLSIFVSRASNMALFTLWVKAGSCQGYIGVLVNKLSHFWQLQVPRLINLYTFRGCQSWTIYYLSSSFLFCKYRWYFQNKSDWSKHKKPANITVTSKICFFGYPWSKFVFLFFSHKTHAANTHASNKNGSYL